MIYGIGAQALGEQLAVTADEASIFMDSFKAKFKGMSLSVFRPSARPPHQLVPVDQVVTASSRNFLAVLKYCVVSTLLHLDCLGGPL